MVWLRGTADNVPAFEPVGSKLLDQGIRWQVDNEKGIGDVCQQERVQAFSLKILNKERGQDLHHESQHSGERLWYQGEPLHAMTS